MAKDFELAKLGQYLTVNTASNSAVVTASVNTSTVYVTNSLAIGNSSVNPLGFGMKNRIINGDMRIWQRGTSGFSNYGYCADRWRSGSTVQSTVTRSSDTPSNEGFIYSLSASCNSSSSYLQSFQNIESFNCTDLVGQSVTFSFWVKQTVGSTPIFVQLNYANSSDNFSAFTSISVQAVASTASWAKYSLTFNNLPIGAANGLQVLIQTQNVTAASTFLVTGLQLEIGTVATPFERRSYGQELSLCQRYFQFFTYLKGVCSYVNGTTTAYIYPTGFILSTMRGTPTGYKDIQGTTTLQKADGTGIVTFASISAINLYDNQTITNIVFSTLGSTLSLNNSYVITYIGLDAEI